MDDDRLQQTVLHVAATRPAMLLGLPIELSVGLGILGAEAGSLHLWWFVGALVPVWFACVGLVSRDYNAVRVFFLWLRTSASAFDSATWGGACITPFPLRRSKTFRGIAPDAW